MRRGACSRGKPSASAPLAPASEALDRTVDAHIVKLRRKLAAAGGGPEAPLVETVFGVGYRLAAPGGDSS